LFWDNNIGDVGAHALAEVLKVKTALKDIQLDHNKIGNVGAQALAEVLKVNQTLKKLFL